MKLRQRTLLLIGIILTSLIAVLSVSLAIILLRSFAKLEEQNVHLNVQRAREALLKDLNDLALTTEDWAAWDATYNYVSNRNTDYVKSNLADNAFVNLRVNYILLFDRQSHLIVKRGYDLLNNQQREISLELMEQLTNRSKLLTHKTLKSQVKGLMNLPEGVAMVVSHPILTSEHVGPIRGSMIMVRYLNTQQVEELANRTHLKLTAYPIKASQLPEDVIKANFHLIKSRNKPATFDKLDRIWVTPLNSRTIVGYILLDDIYNHPSLILRVELSRTIYQQGQSSLYYIITSLVVTGIVFGVITLLVLEKLVLARISTLSIDVHQVGTSHNLAQRVHVKGNDELANLAKTVNWMLEKLEANAQALAIEQENSENLLLNILPKPISERLKQNPGTIAEYFTDVTVMFADIVGFTTLSTHLPANKLVELLNDIFSCFDQLLEKHNLEKIKTIGDCYMVVGGLPVPYPNHAQAVAEMALDIQKAITAFNVTHQQTLQVRIGINTGAVVAGVIGLKKFTYDLWGDTVNTASRMESHGIPGKIHVSHSSYECLKDDYKFESRGLIPIKGKGEMETYLLIGRMF